jgi:hypothetical protein
MLLHGFSAAVIRKFFTPRYMKVRPVACMQQFICKAVAPEDLLIRDATWEKELKASEQSESMKKEHPENFIPVDVLAHSYRTNAQTNTLQSVPHEIKRLRENTDCILSINSDYKANQIEGALLAAVQNDVVDLREDKALQDALAMPRIFNFWGCRPTMATQNMHQASMPSI